MNTKQNIVVYSNHSFAGYRPQMFPEWEVGTEIMCNGHKSTILAVFPFDARGVKCAKLIMARAMRAERARFRRQLEPFFSDIRAEFGL